MDQPIHFISGLPRSGSTLLAAILRQNPRFHAGMTSPVGSLVTSLMRQMSQENETAVFIDDAQRRAVLTAVVQAYYHREGGKVIFDTHRLWCTKLPTLADLFPRAKVICCVRHIPWILDSIERQVRRNHLQPSQMFNFDPNGTVYARADSLGGGDGIIGYAWNALREAYYGEQTDRLLVLTYETLTCDPRYALNALYEFIGEPIFPHDFNNVEYDAATEFDARLGSPGLHSVARTVRPPERQTILPPDLFHRVESDSFWVDGELNLRGVKVV